MKRTHPVLTRTTNLASSIAGISELTMLETRPPEMTYGRFDMVVLLRKISEAGRSVAGDKPVTIVDTSCPGPVIVHSDRDAIKQIVMELLSNAAKFTDRGRIALILARDDDRIRLTVADTGRGMAAKQIKEVFESPDRACDAEVNGHAATGLGLRIVRALVKKLNGSMTASSKLGEGTIIEITLPLEPSAQRADYDGRMRQQLKPAPISPGLV